MYKATCFTPPGWIKRLFRSDYTSHSNGNRRSAWLICCCLQSNPTSLKTLMSLINEVMSRSSPVMASIPGSMRFKNESRSFKVEDTWKRYKKKRIRNNELVLLHSDPINDIILRIPIFQTVTGREQYRKTFKTFNTIANYHISHHSQRNQINV